MYNLQFILAVQVDFRLFLYARELLHVMFMLC